MTEEDVQVALDVIQDGLVPSPLQVWALTVLGITGASGIGPKRLLRHGRSATNSLYWSKTCNLSRSRSGSNHTGQVLSSSSSVVGFLAWSGKR